MRFAVVHSPGYWVRLIYLIAHLFQSRAGQPSTLCIVPPEFPSTVGFQIGLRMINLAGDWICGLHDRARLDAFLGRCHLRGGGR